MTRRVGVKKQHLDNTIFKNLTIPEETSSLHASDNSYTNETDDLELAVKFPKNSTKILSGLDMTNRIQKTFMTYCL